MRRVDHAERAAMETNQPMEDWEEGMSVDPAEGTEGLEIAVIGLAGRFPGARNLDEFWQNLRDGVESVSFFPEEQVIAAGIDPDLVRDPHFVRAGGVLADVEKFDAAFFGIYPQEAAVLDPQHRLFLECAWEALENAGYNPEAYPGAVGVFAGVGMNTYLLNNLLANSEVSEAVYIYQLMLANDKDFVPTRVSYKLNLRGPSVNVQTACSTSLVATHLACQSLLNYQCDMALAGGVSIRIPQEQGYLYQEGGIASPDGHCRPFDASAQGTVGGNGVGIVVLKRLSDALADGDSIRAVIKGSAINNDGSQKVGYTAPSVEGQAEVIAMAQTVAGVDPASISYIETHGTGTVLGDPIEIMALRQVFQSSPRPEGDLCAIGSLKSNVGHLDAAAGVGSLIKTVLALENRQIPPSLHYQQANPRLELENTPFRVNARLSNWEAKGGPRRAGVSSFGIGGTNAHVVLEEAPQLTPGSPGRAWQLLLLSARSVEALEDARANLVKALKQRPDLDLADIAYTLQVGRKAFAQRLAVVCRDRAEALEALDAQDPRGRLAGSPESDTAPVAFLFTGQGAQYVDMGRGLYAEEPVFREQVDRACEMLRPHLGLDLRELLFPETGQAEAAAERLRQTGITQPALFVIEYALAQLWISLGIQPEALTGHSIGEYVAACLAGVFSLEDALALVAARGRLMQALPGGAMLSVPLSEAEIQPYLDEDLALAAVNAPALCAVSGTFSGIEALEGRLAAAGVEYRRLHTSHAFHSAMMDPILDEFARLVGQVERHAPQIPFISNLTGTWITAEQAADPQYWAQHLRRTVRFADGIGVLLEEPARILLETGPGRTLSSLAKAHPAAGPDRTILSSLRHPQDQQPDEAFMLHTLGKLWLAGVPVDWEAYHSGERRRRVPLPTYPFERQRFWVDPQGSAGLYRARPETLRKRPDPAGWFYLPSWKRTGWPGTLQPDGLKDRRWLVLGADTGLGSELARRLQEAGAEVVRVYAGRGFVSDGEGGYAIDPANPGDYAALLERLRAENRPPDSSVHLWSLVSADPGDLPEERLLHSLDHGFYSLLYLAQALGGPAETPAVNIYLVTTGVHEVTGQEALRPENALLPALGRVIAQENQRLGVRSIDIEFPRDTSRQTRLVDRLAAELAADPNDREVAWRGEHRWAQQFEPLPSRALSGEPRLRPGGAYLITGGLGRIGLALSGALAQRVQARLALVDRVELPGRDDWEAWLAGHDGSDPSSARIRQIQALEARQAEVLYLRADVTDPVQLRAAVQEAVDRFGGLHGVVHAAGLVGEASLKTVQETGREAAEAHFSAKVHGLNTLAEVLKDHNLDFCLLQSSLSAVLGGLGMGAYAAANAYMDAIAWQQNRAGRTPWISVNWDGWRFAEEAETGPAGRKAVELALTPEEGVQVFERLLALPPASQVVVSTGDLQARLARWVSRLPGSTEAPGEPAEKPAHQPRPKVRSTYVAPRTPLEEAIAGLWQKALGIEPVGVYDDFFELGGHSLLATQLVSRLRDTYGVELPLRRLFESPVIASLAELIEASRTEAQSASSPAAAGIPRAPRDGRLPLSSGQQRLWFLDQLEPGSPLYNNSAAVRITGRLDLPVLERCLNEIIRRHEALRTTFQEVDGQPAQVIADILEIPLEVVDLQALPGPEQEQRLQELALGEARLSFDLRRGPLLRFKLLRLAPEEQVILMTTHHIISDGWSVLVLIQELAALYPAFSTGQPSPLPELPIQYADYAAWQRARLQGETLETELGYWKEVLGGDLPILELPTDRPRPAVQTSRGSNLWFELPVELSKKLEDLSQQEGATLFMTLLAALLALLYRYTGQEDLTVGTPVANRSRSETEGLIGFLLNTLVIRAGLSGRPTFRELLGRVKSAALGAYAHQDLPFEMLVEALQPARDMSRSPLFQVIFDLQIAPLESLSLAGLTFRPMPIDNGTAKFDLALSMEQAREGLRGYWNYNTDLFDAATIERLLEHFRRLLEGIAADPECSIADLPLLSEAELRQVLVEWNPAAPEEAPATSVHLAFEARSAQAPDDIALVYGERRMSYAELNARANRLARYLRRLGVAPEQPVGVCLERSPEAIVALLGVLKAGGAYLPLDPGYPVERLEWTLNDAAATVLVSHSALIGRSERAETQSEGLDLALIKPGRSVVLLDGEAEAIAREEPGNPAPAADRDCLAYVIYTSGSTGLPKGVMVTHGTLADHCRSVERFYQLTAEDRVLQFAALNFDPSLEQILPTLIAGAQLVLRPEEMDDPANFPALAREFGLTVANLVPAYWHQVAQAWASQPHVLAPDLRLVIIGGDVVPRESLKLWLQSPARGARLLNAYGPTETTITAATFEMTGEELTRPVIPIGRPLPGRKAYVLDRDGSPAPAGVPGELHLGGTGLARGYLNRRELSEEKFIPYPQRLQIHIAEISGEAPDPYFPGLYRTGDRVRFLADGNLEFLGRVDQQVKVRGFRIECGEIEAALSQHPAVQDAAVVAREDTPGEKRLVAYLVARQPSPAGVEAGTGAAESLSMNPAETLVSELRIFLQSRLPAYMVPAVFVVLDALPLTSSGKVDRRALPAPEGTGADSGSRYVAPRTPVEAELAGLWAQVLNLERVGIYDNFFDLGGHSLLATQLVARVRGSFRVDLPLRELFEAPTVAGLAALVARSLAEAETSEALDELLDELENLSDEEVQRLLAEEESEA